MKKTDLEACPHCGGTGKRVVPPPALTRGVQVNRGNPTFRPGRTHGYESTYSAGCRCELCRAAHREGTRRRRQRVS